MNRRDVLFIPAIVVPAAAAGGGVYAALAPQRDKAQTRAAELEAQVATLQQSSTKTQSDLTAAQQRVNSLSSRWVASGGGTNKKMMPDASGNPTVEMLEVFSFDRNHAYCRVDDNPQAFVMPTFKMGNVTIPARSFFMSMATTTIDQFDAKDAGGGKAQVLLRGNLDCHTEVNSASLKVGSRTAGEPASYEIVAVDGGPGGGPKGDSFAFTVFFDERTAPLNYAIFGPKFTFTGEMVEGEITIRNLASFAT
jgi:outer membrane murein-binding lipoprotein Lpp